MPDPRLTPAGGAAFYYQVQPDGQDGFTMTWWIEAAQGDARIAKAEPAASEQEAQQQAHIVAERHGFTSWTRIG